MVATPFLGYVVLQEEYTMACAGLALFGFSDWLDGYIARTYNQTSVLGTFLDPFADKILIMTLVAVEGWGGLLPLSLVALILARDAGLIAGGFYIRGTTKPEGVPFFDTTQASALKVTPSMLSKLNTCSQVGLLMFALTNAAWGFPGDDMVTGLCWLTGATTFGSGLDYYINRPITGVSDDEIKDDEAKKTP
jgi:cardiolipin synthase